MTLPDLLTRGPMGEIGLTGHRIDLYLIVLLSNEGYTSEMLHDEYPTLPLDLINEVLAFYLENKAKVDAYMAEVESTIEQFRANYQPGPGILRMRKLMEERALLASTESGKPLSRENARESG
jgi:uncharacterized protein (DUF433 family)